MNYYCIGIKGTGMSTLAQMLFDMGYEVAGYDDCKEYKFTQKGLEKRNIPIYYDDSYIPKKDTIVTASKAFQESHPEILRMKELGFTLTPYNDVVGMITKQFLTLSVCGTHGKTTTTSLIHHLILNCNYFIGDGSGHINKEENLLVIESDEFNRHFLAYSPKTVVLTCIELEHTEIYKDLADTIETFEKFCNYADCVIANGDDLNVRKINFKNKVIFCGEKDNNDYIIKNIKLEKTGSSFDLYQQDQFLDTFTIPLYGKHMVLNAALGIIASHEEGISYTEIKERLKTFKNAARRFQEEKVGNTIIIDDYAHHPTEIKVTLEAIRQKYPDKHLTVVFRPNTYSRTSYFKQEFADSLKLADKAYITPIKCDRERKEDYPPISSEDLIALIPSSSLIDDESIEKLKQDKDGIICFMGCASVSGLINNLKKVLTS